jgi:hypothetical protein
LSVIAFLLPYIQFLPHAVFDIVVDNEIQLFVSETIMLGEKAVNLVDDGFGEFGIVFIVPQFNNEVQHLGKRKGKCFLN